jgi:hypothetical protein
MPWTRGSTEAPPIADAAPHVASTIEREETIPSFDRALATPTGEERGDGIGL